MGWILISLVAVLVLFVALGFTRSGWKLRPRQLFSLFGLLLVCGGIVATVPTGHTGILTTFGKVEDITLEAGVHFKLPVQKVVVMDNRTQVAKITLTCFSSDIQEVLVEESNNSDSKKYAILTTTDSFYRYKEAVKELLSKILNDNELKKEELFRKGLALESDSVAKKRNEYSLEYCEDATRLVYQVEREFDIIERKYNKLIEQKTIFAKRALARIHYILQEGSGEEDTLLRFIHLLDHSSQKEEIFSFHHQIY